MMDALMKEVARREFDMVAAWSVERTSPLLFDGRVRASLHLNLR